jgi:hypothetical protein
MFHNIKIIMMMYEVVILLHNITSYWNILYSIRGRVLHYQQYVRSSSLYTIVLWEQSLRA